MATFHFQAGIYILHSEGLHNAFLQSTYARAIILKYNDKALSKQVSQVSWLIPLCKNKTATTMSGQIWSKL